MAKDNPQTPVNESPENSETEIQEGAEGEGQEEQAGEQSPSIEGQGQEEKGSEAGKAEGDLGKFTDVEELVKSYKALESHTTKVSQELADTRRFLAELRNDQISLRRQIPQGPAAPPEPVDWTNPDKAATTVTQREIIKAIPIIVNHVNQIMIDKQFRAIRNQDPVKFDRAAQKMYELSQTHQEFEDDPFGPKKLFDLAITEMEKISVTSDPQKMADTVAPIIAKMLGITVDTAKKALQGEANQRTGLKGLGGGKSVGPPRQKDVTEEVVEQMERYR